jgi:hypothetical protein
MKPQVSSKGISSQSNGAQQLPGTYTKHPFPENVGKNASHEMKPDMGAKCGGDALGQATGRKYK